MIEMGALDPAGTNPLQLINTSVIDAPAHRDLARRLATESIVLLKVGYSCLPLHFAHVVRILLTIV